MGLSKFRVMGRRECDVAAILIVELCIVTTKKQRTLALQERTKLIDFAVHSCLQIGNDETLSATCY